MDFKAIEQKWQNKWEEEHIFEVEEDNNKEKYYVLEMFPYPSGSGLHMGHALNYTIGDIFARFKIMQGFNVIHPMGYDALGLPAENAAIKDGTHPEDYTNKSIQNYIRQQKELGLTYDWSRVVNTASPEYYKWDQWIFLKLFEKGLAYQKESAVNWCPECNTVLANEQVHDGKCWRHEDTNVEIKQLRQWFIKTTHYAQELYDNIDTQLTNWPDRTRAMQKNWIGKSYGTEISFDINGEKWPVFTTRPDTLFGVTFMVVSAQHKKLMSLVTEEQKEDVEKFLKTVKSVSEKEMESMEKLGVFTGSYATNPATGQLVPVYAGNFVVADYGAGMVMAVPAHDQRDFEFAKKYNIPIKQVIMSSNGDQHKDAKSRRTITAVVKNSKDQFLIINWKTTGWISAPIGGIEQDEDLGTAAEREVLEETGYKTKFVRKLGFEIESNFYADHKKEYRHRIDQPVLLELIDETPIKVDEKEAALHEPVWLSYKELMKQITHEYNKVGFEIFMKGEKAYTEPGVLVNSEEFNGLNNQDAKEKITDWLISKGVGKKVLNFKLRDWGISRQRYWGTPIPMIHCSSCGTVPVKFEDLPVKLPKDVKFGDGNPLETSESFVNVSCPKCNGPAKRETDTMDTFANSSWYFLRYTDPKNNEEIFSKEKAAYWSPVDLYIGGAEHACMHLIYARFYTKFLRDLGLINFDEPSKKLFHQGMLHGEDGFKMSKSKGNVILPETVSKEYGMDTARLFLVSAASPDKDIDWSTSGIEGSLKLVNRIINYFEGSFQDTSKNLRSKLQRTVRDVTEDINNMRYNLATIKIRDLFGSIEKERVSKDDARIFLQLIAPFAPHIAEELWERLEGKGFISTSPWPVCDESLIDEKAEAADELIHQVEEDIQTVFGLAKIDRPNKITIIISPDWKYTFFSKVKELLSNTRNAGEIIKSVMATDLKIYSKDIMKLIPILVKDSSKIPLVILDSHTELESLNNQKDFLTKKFNCDVEIVISKESSHPKALNGSPSKPAIVVE